jgi:hypothetical protein
MRRWIYATVSVLGLVGGAVLAGVLNSDKTPSKTPSTQSATCGEADLICLKNLYEIEIKSGRGSSVVAGLLTSTPEARGCHETAHVVGRLVGYYQPNEALEMNTSQLDSRCDYGYMHGVFQGLAEVGVDPVIAAGTYCSAKTGMVERDECFHAAGHGAAIVGGTLENALKLCLSLSGEALASCRGGIYMEHVSSYLAVHLFTESRKEDYGPTPVSTETAENMCMGLDGENMYPCARKAALFWGPTMIDTNFKDRCEYISKMVSEAERALHACGAGVGEWLRNSGRWGIPETAKEAQELNKILVDSCVQAIGNNDGILMAACVEGVVTAVLPGQMLGIENKEAWVNPCAELDSRGFSYAVNDCKNLRKELGAGI